LRIQKDLSMQDIYWIESVRRRTALNFERSKIWVWGDDAFRHRRFSPFKSGLNDLGRPNWSLRFCQFISLLERATDKQLCISIQLWFIDTISFLWVCCSRIYLDIAYHFSKPLFHPIVTPSISISIFMPERHWPDSSSKTHIAHHLNFAFWC
jgi:hypothetical protein